MEHTNGVADSFSDGEKGVTGGTMSNTASSGMDVSVMDMMHSERGCDESASGDMEETKCFKRHEIKLFVGGVPQSYTDAEVRTLFEKFGRVKNATIIKHRDTNAHKGSAFVFMESLRDGDKAIREIMKNPAEYGVSGLQVRYAAGEMARLKLDGGACQEGEDETKLFVGSVPKSATVELITDTFKTYGTVNEVFIMKDNATGLCKGCAFVKMRYKEDALNAIEGLNEVHTIPGNSRPVEVRFAALQKKDRVSGGRMPGGQYPQYNSGQMMGQYGYGGGAYPQFRGAMSGGGGLPPYWKEYCHEGRPYFHNEVSGVVTWDKPMADACGPAGANLFVFFVPNDLKTENLHYLFGKYGNIVSARVVTNPEGESKGYAFVSYDDPSSAKKAISEMNGFQIGTKRLKVELKRGDSMGEGGSGNGGANGSFGQSQQMSIQPSTQYVGHHQMGGVSPHYSNRYNPY